MRLVKVFGLALLLASCIRGWAADPPVALAQIERTAPAPEVVEVQNLDIRQGRAVFRLSKGQLWTLRDGAKSLGHYFRGEGTLEFLSTDRMEHAALKYNAQGVSEFKLEPDPKGLLVRRAFREAAFWMDAMGAPTPGPGLADPTAQRTREQWGAFQKAFRPDTLQAQGPRGGWPHHHTATHFANAPGKPYLSVEMNGQGGPALYRYEPSGEGFEQLFASKSGVWFCLSHQPIGWAWDGPLPPQPFLLTHIDLHLKATETPKASLLIRETIQAQQDGLQCLAMNFLTAHPGLAFKNLASRMVVQSVKDGSGRTLRHRHEADRLLVELPEPLAKGGKVELAFDLAGDFLFRPQELNQWQLGVMPWFPQPELGGQHYTVHAIAEAPEPLVPIMPGQTIRRTREGKVNLHEVRIDKPVQFFVVDAGKYESTEDARPGRTVRVWTYVNQGANQKRIANLSHQFISFYEQLLGAWPWSEFNVVQRLEYGFGQAPPATMYITQEAFNVIGDKRAGVYARGINDRIAHELAHQYFGHIVKMGSEEEQWISEAFSECASGLAMLQAKGEDYHKQKAEQWKREAAQAIQAGTVHTANRLYNPDRRSEAFGHRRRLIYDKGAYVLYDLQRRIGDEAFFSFLFNLPRVVPFQFGTTRTLQELLQAVTKQDHMEYFEKHFWGTALPE